MRMRNAYKILVGILTGRNHVEDLGIDGRVITQRFTVFSQKLATGHSSDWPSARTILKHYHPMYACF
jgi:hypothetical protein